jgi:hypothetical protein
MIRHFGVFQFHPVHEAVKAIVVPCLARVVVFDFEIPSH